MALAVLIASPPDMRAQSDAYFEAEDFGDNYAYGFSHESYGNDLIYNFSHQIYGSDYIYSFSHQIFGSDYIYGLSHQGFGDDFNGNFGHQGFGSPAPIGSGLVVLLAASAGYTAVKRRRSSSPSFRPKRSGVET